MLYRILRRIHLWLSVPFGLIFTLICLTGAILEVEPEVTAMSGADERLSFFRTVMRLHRWLLDSPENRTDLTFGRIVIAVTTIAVILILITGIWLWCIRARKNARANLTIRLGRGSFPFWSSLHVAGGIYAVLFLLTMALTGLAWPFGGYREVFMSIFAIGDRHAIYGIHTGQFLAIVSRIVWLIAALLGAMLPLTGFYMWIHRLNRRPKALNHAA